MRKVSKILLILGGVFALLTILELFALAFVFPPLIGVMGLAVALINGNEFFITVEHMISCLTNGEFETLVELATSDAFLPVGMLLLESIVSFFILISAAISNGVIYLVGAILAFVGAKGKPGKKGIHIANIIFGVWLESLFILAGGIFGLVAAIGEKKQLAAQEAVVNE